MRPPSWLPPLLLLSELAVSHGSTSFVAAGDAATVAAQVDQPGKETSSWDFGLPETTAPATAGELDNECAVIKQYEKGAISVETHPDGLPNPPALSKSTETAVPTTYSKGFINPAGVSKSTAMVLATMYSNSLMNPAGVFKSSNPTETTQTTNNAITATATATTALPRNTQTCPNDPNLLLFMNFCLTTAHCNTLLTLMQNCSSPTTTPNTSSFPKTPTFHDPHGRHIRNHAVCVCKRSVLAGGGNAQWFQCALCMNTLSRAFPGGNVAAVADLWKDAARGLGEFCEEEGVGGAAFLNVLDRWKNLYQLYVELMLAADIQAVNSTLGEPAAELACLRGEIAGMLGDVSLAVGTRDGSSGAEVGASFSPVPLAVVAQAATTEVVIATAAATTTKHESSAQVTPAPSRPPEHSISRPSHPLPLIGILQPTTSQVSSSFQSTIPSSTPKSKQGRTSSSHSASFIPSPSPTSSRTETATALQKHHGHAEPSSTWNAPMWEQRNKFSGGNSFGGSVVAAFIATGITAVAEVL
ncbi:MAG: hypothetical protein M1831_002205 [Alyxoria varia]|nr:MAG: hypothetical protein M1831_002205 [Alyxoria varia]